jgi:hypothetical protein
MSEIRTESAPEIPWEPLERRLQLVVSEGFLKRLNEWRAKKPDLPNQSKAIREEMERIFREGR